jgi:translation initiation factor IF-2
LAPKKIRVYELARELGLSNAEMLDVMDRYKAGVKSHSASIDQALADRVARKAHADGLTRPPELAPKEEAPAAKGRSKAASGEPQPAEPSVERTPSVAPVEPATITEIRPAAAPSAGPEVVVPAAHATPSTPAAPVELAVAAASAPTTAAEPVRQPAAAVADASAHRIVRSTEGRTIVRSTPTPPAPPAPAPMERPSAPPMPAVAAAAAPAPAPAVAPDSAPSTPAVPLGSEAPAPRPMQPRAPSGKAVPPPPGMGKRPPPPPGMGRPSGPGAGGPGASRGGPGGARPGGGGGFARPGGGPGGGGGGFARPGGGPGGGGGGFARPGGGPGGGGFARPGGGPGGPPGGPAGRGRGPQPQQRRPKKKKGRRQLDELTPQQMSYTPKDAPLPDGDVVVPRGTSCQVLGARLNRTAADLVRILFNAGEMVTGTQSLTDEMIELVFEDFGIADQLILVDPGSEEEHELQALFADDELEDDDAELVTRPPVVTVMGHVDHGKTKLLDRIREANVVASEAGGITQHIGAYQVVQHGRKITFIDTPGHEAFTAMRARGAQATDIAVLVVAADDGVMPQTIEALNHAKAAEVPIVVAINKIDKEDADPTRVRQQLSEHGLIPEEWGGTTMMVELSALQNLGVDDLLEALLLLADNDEELIDELQANPVAPARGVVLEGHLDIGRGPVATALIQRGTLRVGDPVVAGGAWGRVRAMLDEHGNRLTEAGPSTPVQVLGFDEVPSAGDDLRVAPDDKIARTIAEARSRRRRQAELIGSTAVGHGGAKLEDIFAHIQRGEVATLNLIVKADVQGSLEAIVESLRKLERDDVKLAFVHRGVGGITENDIQLAMASNATIIGFNVRPDRIARDLAAHENVEVRLYEVIYQVIEDIQNAMLGLLQPEFEEVVTGEAEVREIFSIPRVGRVAGCMVRHGTITRGSKVRFLREGVIIWKGEVASLRRFKDDVREVQAGFECGVGLENFQDLKGGDLIETFTMREIPRT